MPVTNPITVQGINWKGAWAGGANYVLNDAVSITGSSYIAVSAHTNQQPPNATYWNVLAQSGSIGGTGSPGGAGPQGPAGVGGVSLTGWELIVKPSDIFGWMTAHGSSTGNAAVPIYYSTTNATGNISALGFTSSAPETFQSRYAYATFTPPPYASGWGNSGIRVRVLTTNTLSGNNAISIRINDATGAVTTIADMVSSTAESIKAYTVDRTNGLMPFSHDLYSVRFDFRVRSGASGCVVGVDAHYV